jgi:ATP-binding cassette subfamily C (CFTR/MRP) protein 1
MNANHGIAVWIKWWSDANAKSPNKDIGMYIGVYSVLSIGAYLSIVLLVW